MRTSVVEVQVKLPFHNQSFFRHGISVSSKQLEIFLNAILSLPAYAFVLTCTKDMRVSQRP